MRIRKKDRVLTIFAAIFIILFIALIVISVISSRGKKVDYSNMTDEEISTAIKEEIDEMKKNDLGGMGERDRMEYYVGSFITAVENKKYEEAYEMLYSDFRKNYFPTFSDFENYAKTKFPTMISVEHTNFERNGEVYVLWSTLSNPMGDKNSSIEMNFIIKENDLNDFDLSFKVF